LLDIRTDAQYSEFAEHPVSGCKMSRISGQIIIRCASKKYYFITGKLKEEYKHEKILFNADVNLQAK
jgi:hypothetical protein